MTANGEVQTREEATVFVKELDLFVTVMLLEETPTVFSLGKLCEDHGYTYHWTSGQKPHLIRNGKKIDCNISNIVPFVVPGLLTSSSSPTSLSIPAPSSSQESISANREHRYLENPVSERSGGTNGELLVKPAAWINNQKQKWKWRTLRSTKRSVAWLSGLAAGFQIKFGRWRWSYKTTGKNWAEGSRHCQFSSWTSNGAASKSGTEFG